jgi:hypothetical protein
MPAATKTLWFVRSLAAAVVAYRIDQQQDGGDWTEIATVWAVPDQWAYQFATAVLDDLSIYSWRVVALDAAGNACDEPLELGPEKMVRTPDAPAFEIALDAGAGTVTFAESAG